MSSELRALVVGGTGAVGRHVVGELLRSKACATMCLFARILNRALSQEFAVVTTIGRRPVTLPDEYAEFKDSPKLVQKVVGSQLVLLPLFYHLSSAIINFRL